MEVQVAETAALGRPDERAILQEAQVAVKVDPDVRLLGEEQRPRAAARVVQPQVQPKLVAALDLDGELAVGPPIDACQVDVWFGAEVQPAGLAAPQRDDAEAEDRK